jgi:hypothetical protein
MKRRAAAHVVKDKSDHGCMAPKNGLPKKATSFYKGCCMVRFDRKTMPKSGKSFVNGCFVEKKSYAYLVWDTSSRALLGIVKHEHELEEKAKEWKRRIDDMRRI